MRKSLYKILLILLCLLVCSSCSKTPPKVENIIPIVESTVKPKATEIPVKEVPKENIKLCTVRISVNPIKGTITLLDKLVMPLDDNRIITFNPDTPVLEYQYSNAFNGMVKLGPVREARGTQNSVIVSQRLNTLEEYEGLKDKQISPTENEYSIITTYADNTYLTQIKKMGLAILVQDYLPKAVWDKIKDDGAFVDEGIALTTQNANIQDKEIASYKQNVVIQLGEETLLNKETIDNLSEINITPNRIGLTFSTGDIVSIYLSQQLMGDKNENIKVKTGSVSSEWSKITFTENESLIPTICYAKQFADKTIATVVSDKPIGDYTIDLKKLTQTFASK